MNICLIGPSGAGKGTHSARLLKKFNFIQLNTGELLRSSVEKHNAIGFLANYYVERGELVPDNVVNAIAAEWLHHAPAAQNILVDGYPRTLDQARFLDTELGKHKRTLDAVLFLELSDAVVMERLLGRQTCPNCGARYHVEFHQPKRSMLCDRCDTALTIRNDDIRSLIRVRLRAFRRELQPVLDFYKSSGRLLTVDANKPIESISSELLAAVDSINNGSFRYESGENEDIRNTPTKNDLSRSDKNTVAEDFNLVLIGGPGSGKGTQAENLQGHLHLPHISTGSLFRENLNNHTELGTLAKSFMERGELVPDDVTEAMVEDRLSEKDVTPGFILDGFPRSLPQTLALGEIMSSLGRSISGAIYIRVSDAEIVKRISGRLICSDCQSPFHIDFKPPKKSGHCDACGGSLYQRDDDNETTVQARLKTFHMQTAPIINHYHDMGVLEEIDGEGDVDSIAKRCIDAAEKLEQNSGLSHSI
ncbi:MAG: adenylate kinase [Pseudomonadota bacterium]